MPPSAVEIARAVWDEVKHRDRRKNGFRGWDPIAREAGVPGKSPGRAPGRYAGRPKTPASMPDLRHRWICYAIGEVVGMSRDEVKDYLDRYDDAVEREARPSVKGRYHRLVA